MDIELEEKPKEEGTANNPIEISRKKLPLRERIRNFFKNPKKRLIFEIVLGLILIAIFGTGMYLMTREKTAPVQEETKKAAEETKYPAALDGVMTDKESAEKHPLAIVVENDPAARPQSGLDKASIIYETVYDPAATTRFMALYGTYEAEKVGPTRSARTFFVDWAHGYDAFFAHWGGNMDALDQIRAEKIYDLDEFTYPKAYWKESTKGKATEHTGYTSTLKLREQAAANKYPTANNFTVYKFKDESAENSNNNTNSANSNTNADTQAPANNITVNFSNASYKVDFIYDKATNSYKRNLAGSAHKDALSGGQLNPKNIAVMTVARKSTKTRINEPGYTMTTTGSGNAKIFIDGKQISGTWKKNSAAEREIFYDATGQEVVFNRGQLWICVVADDKVVTTQ